MSTLTKINLGVFVYVSLSAPVTGPLYARGGGAGRRRHVEISGDACAGAARHRA
ncbi:hypothetical protein ACQP2P_39290 [Dactylosporangium sp. CA-139114]|uniref:hypothetical protein n=1 Tax=Dactylosporangium sp. CA-139114 TaxID=3239931 RepID=UPI003D95799E